jgi:enoyl-[acyl-carrier-protein] reductase (NADH)
MHPDNERVEAAFRSNGKDLADVNLGEPQKIILTDGKVVSLADVDQTYSSGQIANIVAYLLSADGHAITGQVIEPDNHPGVA